MRDEAINQVRYRAATVKDSKFVYRLRFDPDDLDNYFTSVIPPLVSHRKFWLDNYQSYCIAECNGLRVGYYGLVNEDFRYAVVPSARGKGIGKNLVTHAILTEDIRIAKVAINNLASIKCFLSCGFVKTSTCKTDSGKEYIVLERLKEPNKSG